MDLSISTASEVTIFDIAIDTLKNTDIFDV